VREFVIVAGVLGCGGLLYVASGAHRARRESTP
jgi:hypothetical protein